MFFRFQDGDNRAGGRKGSRSNGSKPDRALHRSTNKCAGFSLLELVVATAILSMAVVGLLSLVTVSLANAARVREYDRAAMLARSAMNTLLVQDPLPLGQSMGGKFDDDSGWSAVAEPFELPRNARSGQTMVARVGLKIWWESDGRRKSIDLEGFRRMIIRPEHGIGP